MPDNNYEPKPYETSGMPNLDAFIPADLVMLQAEKDAAIKAVRKAVEESEALEKIADPIIAIALKLLDKIPLALV